MQKNKLRVGFMAMIFMFTGLMGGCGSRQAEQGLKEVMSEQEENENGLVTVTIASNTNQLKSLDKFNNTGAGVDDTGYLWGDPLIANDHKGNYEPALAVKWEMREDGLVCIFQLRENVKFHNGAILTAADVKATYERLINGKLQHTNSWNSLERVDTSDEKTVTFYFSTPMPTFYDEVGFVPIINAKAYEKDPKNYFQKPIGTGAYYVESFDQETGKGKFRRNQDWWGTNSGNVDEIIYTFIADDTKRATALKNGKADVVNMLSVEYQNLLKDTYKVNEIHTDTCVNLGFCCTGRKVFADKNLRQALSMSIDRQMLCDNIAGSGAVLNWPVGENTLGYIDSSSYVYDMEQARALVKNSDYDGREIILIYTNEGFQKAEEIAMAVQTRAKEIGLNMVVEPLKNAEFLKRRAEGEYDVTLGAFAATCGDPQTEVAVIIADDIFGTGYQNADMEQLCEKVKLTMDRTERENVLKDIFKIEMEELAPFVYLYSPNNIVASQNYISNITFYNDYSADYRFMVKETSYEDS